jgi:fumarylacetoacetase
VPDGATIRRPQGLRGPSDFGPTLRLDFEAELGFVVGVPAPGGRVPVAAFADHVFGVCVVNDWSARDIQRFETVPLGPFLGKSFATSISDWIVPLAELAEVRCDPPAHEQAPAGYLRDDQPWALDLGLTVHINDVPVATDLPVRELYWTGAQMLAHMTVNGAGLRTGDLYASGTVSGEHAQGCLLELTWGGRQTIEVGPMSRTWLEDGDTVTVSAPRLGLRTSGTVAG